MLQKIQKFFSEKGQGTVEYALLLAVVAAIAYYLTLADDGVTAQAKTSVENMKTQATAANDLYPTDDAGAGGGGGGG